MKKVNLFGFLVLLIASGTVVLGILTTQRTINSTGTIFIDNLNFQAYVDSDCTQIATDLSYGQLRPGDVGTKTIYLKNIGNIPMTVSCTFDTWVPSNANQYLTPYWDAEGVLIQPGQVRIVIYSLTVSPSITGITTYSYRGTITATG